MLPSRTLLYILSAGLALPVACAEQTPMATRPGRSTVDLAELFGLGANNVPDRPLWSRERWNGLVSFAGAPPLRCWGVENEVAFDVAVIGAPFDAATGYRPGCVSAARI